MTVVVMRVKELAWMVVVVLLAGCVGDSDDVDAPDDEVPGDDTPTTDPSGKGFQRTEDTELEKELGAFRLVPADEEEWGRGNVSLDNWYLLSTATGSTGTVVAFEMEVSSEILNGDKLVLEFAPTLTPMGVEALSEDTLFTAVLVKPDATVADRYVQSRIETGSGDVSLPSPDPFTLIGEGISEGDVVYVVIAARDGEPEFGLGMRILDSANYQDHEASVQSWSAFHGAVGEEVPPFVLPRAAEGEGLLYAVYHEIHDGTSYQAMWTPDVAVQDDAPDGVYPNATTRMVTLSSDAGWGGWSEFIAQYRSAGEPGQWSASVDLHGSASIQEEGAFLNLQFGQELPVQGEPPPTIYGDGEGGSGASVEFALTKGGTVATTEELWFMHYSVGIQFSELVGTETEPRVFSDGGLPLP